MKKEDKLYKAYLDILEAELKPAMGCTEPIAVAYCAAKAREVLGETPDVVDIKVSGNIIKNVKSVVVPNTGGMKGIEAAAAAGIVAGDAARELEVIASVEESKKTEIKAYLKTAKFTVAPTYGEELLEIIITVKKGDHSAMVQICKAHANIVLIKKDDQIIFEKGATGEGGTAGVDKHLLNVKAVIDFANSVDIDDVKALLDRQISYNTSISDEGLKENWGANIGKILSSKDDSLRTKMMAAAAAGSDARMSGCELPVVIVSGSGNQGITASMPVIVYARENKLSDEQLYRALCVSDLLAVHLKTGIGSLSAFCGAVCAGIGAATGIAYLEDGSYEAVSHTIINAAGILSGMICDGAKPSCAAKISEAVNSGLLAYDMYKSNNNFLGGDGILAADVEKTIENLGRLGRVGMFKTDHEILDIMTE